MIFKGNLAHAAIKLRIERELPVPTTQVWAFLGEGFADWPQWATAFESCSLDSANLGKGSIIRTYKLKKGNDSAGTVMQEVLAYDPLIFVLKYLVILVSLHAYIPSYIHPYMHKFSSFFVLAF